MSKKFSGAFTLAEILITIAVIGTAALLTIPNLVIGYEKKATATKVRKTVAEFTQVIKLSEIDNGPIKNWNYGTADSIDETERFMNKYILPYYSGITKCSTGIDYSCGEPISAYGINYVLNNGIGLSIRKMYNHGALGTIKGAHSMFFIISTNINKGEKVIQGRDYFYFVINIENGEVLPTGWFDGITREDVFNGWTASEDLVNGEMIQSNYTCKKTPRGELGENVVDYYRHGCTALFVLDGWEFKDDYPW